MKQKISRRSFIGTMAAATAAVSQSGCMTLPRSGPRPAGARRTMNEKVQIGSIGFGMQGGGNTAAFLNNPKSRVVAVCDVDAHALNGAVNGVNGHYKNQDCKAYKDFRDLLAHPGLDAVVISTPDHWHAIMAIMAAEAGLDIFCEKPLSHSLGEGVAMVEAVQKRGRIWQTGSWQRSQGLFRWAAQLVQNGYIGKVTRVEVGLPGGHIDFGGTGNGHPDSEPPAHVDYDMWLGPAQKVPFNICRFHKNWRWNYNTGGGNLMDWIGHHLDIAHWGLANPEFGCCSDDEIGPLTVSATAELPDPNAVWNTATKFRVECMYPNNVEVVIAGGHGDIQGGAKWIGPDGWVRVDRGALEASNRDWIREIRDRENAGELKVQLTKSPGHMDEFVDCILSRQRTLTPVEVAQRSQTPGHLGLIAARLGRTIKWDARRQRIIGDAEATAMMSRKPRAPWKL
jgi:predicted dehydrogenase